MRNAEWGLGAADCWLMIAHCLTLLDHHQCNGAVRQEKRLVTSRCFPVSAFPRFDLSVFRRFSVSMFRRFADHRFEAPTATGCSAVVPTGGVPSVWLRKMSIFRHAPRRQRHQRKRPVTLSTPDPANQGPKLPSCGYCVAISHPPPMIPSQLTATKNMAGTNVSPAPRSAPM